MATRFLMKAGVWVAIKRMTAGVKAAAWKVEVARLAGRRLRFAQFALALPGLK
ncbi:MAG: hypothetical protein WA671_02040 [Candidatus Sulfotelmatobacter sp.]